ncbi:MAG: 16S rRNA (adenine(1518)-N(6)/adenine(1519)-N(6))-dimethyltransferase RsmA [Bacteroidales bacterium]|nr:16S rRNA (adenine(1518)-N(6)/adenine(1519)-N(6))-dimethyltransferase RsmA [Bacteroidales bacterium]
MTYVKAKKYLGQHFLKNEGVASQIAESFDLNSANKYLEIGPGMGVLTKYFINNPSFYACEVDLESIDYLKQHYPDFSEQIYNIDFLQMDIPKYFETNVSIIGNFPYNISSQILFKVLENKEYVPHLVGMFQKEVAERICSGPGNKDYGILSVLLQAYYNCKYLFTVLETDFIPPPKVKSGVISIARNETVKLDCDEVLFKKVVKTAFNQRRKTIRNSIKQMTNGKISEHVFFSKRPEQLSVPQFVELTNIVADMQLD